MADWNALHRDIKSEYKIASDDLKSVKHIFTLDGGRSQNKEVR